MEWNQNNQENIAQIVARVKMALIAKPRRLPLGKVVADCGILFRLLNEYKYLVDSFLIDYFTHHLWDNLPTTWKEYLCSLNIHQLANLTLGTINLQAHEVPPTFNFVVQTVNELKLKRNIPDNISLLEPYECDPDFITTFEVAYNALPYGLQLINEYSNFMSTLFLSLKDYERQKLCIMAKIVYMTYLRAPVDFIVDVEPNDGYLSRLLTFGYNVNVITFVDSEEIIEKLKLEDKEFERILIQIGSRRRSLIKQPIVHYIKPSYVVFKMNEETSIQEFKMFLEKLSGKKEFTFGLAGTSCGTVALNVMKFYKEIPECKFLVNSSCCYNKFDIRYPFDQMWPPEGAYFPMSSLYRSRFQVYGLTAASANLAYHTTEIEAVKLETRQTEFLTRYAFRAVLEKILVTKYPGVEHVCSKHVVITDDMTFYEYCKEALEDTGCVVTEAEVNHPDILRMFIPDQFVRYNCLRSLFAPLIETFILYDGYLYLAENAAEYGGIFYDIRSYFNPKTSPRSHVLVAHK